MEPAGLMSHSKTYFYLNIISYEQYLSRILNANGMVKILKHN